jgi:hypothetical protein
MWHETNTLPQMQQTKRAKPVQQIKTRSGYMHIYDFNRETDIAKFEREMAA